MTGIQAPQTPVILCIMDGWGSAQAGTHNAVSAANTPTIDALMASVPHAALSASGPDVGLPEGQPGNSEVGHLTIGSGRLIEQDLPRIDGVIARDGLADMAEMQAFLSAMKASGGAVHLLGLLSDGGVHAHSRHIRALANLLAAAGLLVHVHMFTDGRDTMPKIADKMLTDFQDGLDETVQISTVTGRYFAMDRDKRWARTLIARDVILHGKAPYQAADAAAAIQAAYERGEQDESQKLLQKIPAKGQSRLVAMDPTGKDISSEALATLISDWRSLGVNQCFFAIGGADGHAESLLDRADHKLAFGRAIWPHMLFRVMLAEQLYRAEMIIKRHPYHRG